ncbi:hypothetical protein [Metabacillus sp. FJAT-53654]|uniref:Uncharacterized protein n=1 Tax=Metabacillus rhizosphaerae TaxID=3117747 RepID=A0ABZ2MNN4_9BACI
MNDILSIIGYIGVVICFILKHSETFAKLNKMQKIGVLMSYITTTIIAGICIYYGGALLIERFQNEFLIFIIPFAVVIITLGLAIVTLNRILQKITKGIFSKIT